MDDKLKQILNKANSQGASHDQLLSITKTYYSSKSASAASTTPVVKPTTTTTPKVSTAPTTTTKVSGDTTTIVSKNEPITIDIAPSTTAPTSVVNPMDMFKKFFGEGIYGAGTVGGTLFGANTERTGDKKLDRKKQNGEGAELTPGFTVPSTFEAIKSKYASDIHFELNANVDEETGIDRTTGLPIEKWSQIDSNLNKSVIKMVVIFSNGSF